jgi:hypothetical protein
MKKLLFVALVAALVAGTADARRRSCSNYSCEPKHEVKCERECGPCIGKPVCVENTTSCNTNQGCPPELCYLVPAPRNVKKHTHVETTITYSCADKPCCAVDPTQDQIEQLRASGAIPATCN